MTEPDWTYCKDGLPNEHEIVMAVDDGYTERPLRFVGGGFWSKDRTVYVKGVVKWRRT